MSIRCSLFKWFWMLFLLLSLPCVCVASCMNCTVWIKISISTAVINSSGLSFEFVLRKYWHATVISQRMNTHFVIHSFSLSSCSAEFIFYIYIFSLHFVKAQMACSVMWMELNSQCCRQAFILFFYFLFLHSVTSSSLRLISLFSSKQIHLQATVWSN